MTHMIELLPALGCVAMMVGGGALMRRLTGPPRGLIRRLRGLTGISRGDGRDVAGHPGA